MICYTEQNYTVAEDCTIKCLAHQTILRRNKFCNPQNILTTFIFNIYNLGDLSLLESSQQRNDRRLWKGKTQQIKIKARTKTHTCLILSSVSYLSNPSTTENKS